ncbi:UvrD-helicase domain-containing protein [Candidatus Uhrbacteria bacterium]|nr:UvrD-helicase domain-containing protein [Candidatus Uhrbacteria bacterium]
MTKRIRTTTHATPVPAFLADLNPEQYAAVCHASGPLLIVAGAGTGKTTVITRRIAWLILEQHVPTDGVLALTFTEKAATEMEERLDRLLPYGYVDLWVNTFHGFCDRILKRHALDIGLPNDYRVLDPTAAWMLLREHLDELPLEYYRPRGNPTKFLHALLQHFSRCRDEAVTPAEYLAYTRGLQLNSDTEQKIPRHLERSERSRKMVGAHEDTGSLGVDLGMTEAGDPSEIMRITEVANAYHAYEQLLLKEGALDFGDLLLRTLELFRTRPAILARYRKQFAHILVDEFQDTNWAQYEIVKLLAAPMNNLTAVCDDDQAIYRWRGAAMSNILHFKEDYPTATSVSVVTNYRSKQHILDAAYASIQQNNPARLEVTLGLDKKLRADAQGKGIIEILHAQDAGEEARMVAARILQLREPTAPTLGPGQADSRQPQASWNDFAILVRANRQADQFLPVLNAAGIPYQFLASRGLYRKPIILDLFAYLDLLDDHHESTAFYRVLNIPVFDFTYDEVLTLTNWSGRKTQSLYTTLRNATAVPGVTPGTVNKVQHLLELIGKHAELARQKSVREVILAFFEDTGYLKDITQEENAEDHETVQFLNQFWKRVETFEESTVQPTLKHFMAAMDLERDAGEEGALPADPNAGPEAVRVLTVHAAKGLEFRYVFVVNLIEQRFPSTDRSDPIELPAALTKVIIPEGDAHMQEERRLFYVACTRAKEGLYLSYADDYGGTRARKPSRFLKEIGILPARHSEGAQATEESRSMEHVSSSARSLARLGMTKGEASPPTHTLPSRLSFTQLRAYTTCPWQYHYAHVLRIPLRGRWTLSFGQTMHLTLQRFFEAMRERLSVEQTTLFSPSHVEGEREGVGQSSGVPSLDELLNTYDAAWIDDWYASPEQQRDYRENGKRILKEFYAKHVEEGWPTVQSTEQPFTVKFDQYSVRGKADRIDALPDGGVEIVDYKTGKAKTKLEAEDKMQLLIYQVAATQTLGVVPTVLSYYYLEDNSKQSFLGTNEEIEKLHDTIVDVGQKIANGKFAPTPGRHCATCDFKNICPYAQT